MGCYNRKGIGPPVDYSILNYFKIMSKGLFIPDEILLNENLKGMERILLAFYWYYTVNGDLHCCVMKNEDVCKKIGISDVRKMQRFKSHLKELGLIKTDGGIKVYYVGDNRDVKNDTPGCQK